MAFKEKGPQFEVETQELNHQLSEFLEKFDGVDYATRERAIALLGSNEKSILDRMGSAAKRFNQESGETIRYKLESVEGTAAEVTEVDDSDKKRIFKTSDLAKTFEQ